MASGKKGKRVKKKVEKRTASTPTVKLKRKKDKSHHGPKEEEPAGPNPYEVFQNKRRRKSVLGERRSGEKRNVARSRAAAVADRERGLIKETLTDRRVSKFRDMRIGADDSAEFGQSSVQRLVKLRQKQTKRSFSIGAQGKEELTIGGKPISEIEDAELKGHGAEEGGQGETEEFDPDAPWKSQKAQEAIEKQEHEQQLGKLEADFGDIMGELNFRPSKAEQIKAAPVKRVELDDYDKMVKELQFERKATATERLKTPDEIAREKAEELAALERERSARVGASADDDADEDEDLAVPDRDHDSDLEEEEGGESEDEAASDKAESDAEDGAEEGDTVPNMSKEAELDDDDKLGEDCIPLLTAAEVAAVDAMVNAKGEEGLPFSLECPSRKRAIDTLLAGKGPETAVKLVHRVRTCTAVSLAAENKDKLRSFFLALLDYAANVAVRDDGDVSARGMQILYALRPQLIQLAREHPEEAHGYFVERLRVLTPSTLPRVAEVSCLKLIALIFPVTDFQHPITRPASLLVDHWAYRIATLGSEIADLISDAMFLWGTLYDITVVGGRFSMSFYHLGTTLLDSCWASAKKGREKITDASADILALLLKTLRAQAESEPVAARVVIKELMRPAAQRLAAKGGLTGKVAEQHKALTAALDELEGHGFTPLMLFDALRPQIRSLEPIFHEEGDIPGKRGDTSETTQLKRKLTDERRAANRQLRRDAATLQSLKAQKDGNRRVARTTERKRVWKMMDVEKQELKQMMTENQGGMDTSLQRYSQTKERKRENKRMGGNQVAQPHGTPGLKGQNASKTVHPRPSDANKEAKARKTPKKGKRGRH